MRKENSDFRVTFLSRAKRELDTECFAFLELDNYACYVMADGHADLKDCESVKEAMQSILAEFEENPSISKRALKKYLKHAGEVLRAEEEIPETEDIEKAEESETLEENEEAEPPEVLEENEEAENPEVLEENEPAGEPEHSEDDETPEDSGEADEDKKAEENKDRKISIVVAVTNYKKMRFSHAGDARLRIYREDEMYHSSHDIMENELIEYLPWGDDEVPKKRRDRIKKFFLKRRQRRELFTYLGQKNPLLQCSRKIKLKNEDRIALYTRNVWENIREEKLEELFLDTENDIQIVCEQVEDLLLSKEIQSTDHYTVAMIGVNEIYVDPNAKKKKEKVIKGGIIVLIAACVIGIMFGIGSWRRNKKTEEMYLHFERAVTYIEDRNYLRAVEECQEVEKLAKKTHNQDMREEIEHYQQLVETIILADDAFEKKKYIEAQEYYVNAQEKSRYADNVGEEYIEKRLDLVNSYRDIFDNLTLGDVLVDLEDYEAAEQKYLDAKKAAASVYHEDGRRQALDALELLYAKWKDAMEEERREMGEQISSELSAAELVKEGDNALARGDYEGAEVFYLIALERYRALDDDVQVGLLNKKIESLSKREGEVKDKVEDAEKLEDEARAFIEDKEYEKAKKQYQLAKIAYQELGKQSDVERMEGRIDLVDTMIEEAKKEKEDQKEKEEAEAKKKEEEEAKKKAEEEAKKKAEEEARTAQGLNF